MNDFEQIIKAGIFGVVHNQPIGTWSDDSSMALATLDSIVKKRGSFMKIS